MQSKAVSRNDSYGICVGKRRARPYHRMKLMLVGKAARGKTTLLSRISEKGQRGLQDNWVLIRSDFNTNHFLSLGQWVLLYH